MGTNSQPPRAERSRRSLLGKAALLGSLAVGLKAGGGSSTYADDGDAITIGGLHVATKVTELGGVFEGTAFRAYNLDENDETTALMGLVAAGTPSNFRSTAIFGKNGRRNAVGVHAEATGDVSSALKAVALGEASTAITATSSGERGNGLFVGARNEGVRVEAALGHGVVAETRGPSTIAIQGRALGPQGRAIHGDARDGVGVRGDGTVFGVEGFGLTGVLGSGAGDGGVGVFGRSSNNGPAIGVRAESSLVGLLANGDAGEQNGAGVWGNIGQEVAATDAAGAGTGVLGTSPGVAIAGVGGGPDLSAVKNNTAATGVLGIGVGAGSRGVHGRNDQGSAVGVLGESGGARGIGVQGSADPLGVGVLAQGGPRATALSVRGINRFTQAGRGEFAPGERKKVIAGVVATRNSGIVATLNSPPQPGVVLQCAWVNARTKKAVLQLNQPAVRRIKFTYFIVDSPDVL
jgi:hypothetical protein